MFQAMHLFGGLTPEIWSNLTGIQIKKMNEFIAELKGSDVKKD